MWRLKAWYITFLLMVAVSVLDAQEMRIPFVEGVPEITARMNETLDLFPDVNDFERALLYRISEDEYVLETYYREEGRELRSRRILDRVKLAWLQGRLESVRKELAAPVETGQEYKAGRTHLILGATLMALPQSFGLRSLFYRQVNTGYGRYYESTGFSRALPFIYPAVVFGSSLVLTNGRKVLPSAANVYTFGSLMGMGHGALLAGVFDDSNHFESNARTYGQFIFFTSTVEGWLSFALAQKYQSTYVRSMAWNTGNFWGSGIGALLGYGASLSSGDPLVGTTIGCLAGAGGGIALTLWLDRVLPRSMGDIRVINAAGSMGALWGITALGSLGDEKTSVSAVAGMSLIGLATGYVLTKHTGFSKADGGLVFAGTYVGALLGFGSAAFLSDETQVLYTTALGSAVGFIGSYLWMMKGKWSGRKDNGRIGYEWSFNPAALVMHNTRPLPGSLPVEWAGVRARF